MRTKRCGVGRRYWSVLAVIAMLLTAAGAGIAPAGAAPAWGEGDQDQVAALDLAALQPGVFVLEDAGLEAFGYGGVSEGASLEEYQVAAGVDPSGEVLEQSDALEDCGLVRMFATSWRDVASAIDANTAFPTYDTGVRFVVFQFPTAGDATDGMAVLRDDVEGDEDIALGDGDDAFAMPVSQPATEGDVDYTGIATTVRVDRLVLRVSVQTAPDSDRNGAEQPLALDLTERFIAHVEERLPEAADGPGLTTVRFIDPGFHESQSGYVLYQDEPGWAYPSETAAERDERIAAQREDGIITHYEGWQWGGETTAEIDRHYLTTHAWVFADDDAAAAFLDNRLPYWREGDWDVETIEHVADVGDETLTIEAVDPDRIAFYSTVAWRDGATVREVGFRHPERFVDHAALRAMLDAQLDCIDAGDCWRYRELPEAIRAEIVDDAGPDDADDRAGTPTATEEPVGDATVFVNDQFGFTVSWEGEFWTRDETAETRLDPDGLVLRGDDRTSLYVGVFGRPDGLDTGSPESCLEDLTELARAAAMRLPPTLALASVTDGAGGPLAGAGDGYAWTALRLVYEEGVTTNLYGCATLEEGLSMVIFVLTNTSPELTETRIEQVLAVMTSLTVV